MARFKRALLGLVLLSGFLAPLAGCSEDDSQRLCVPKAEAVDGCFPESEILTRCPASTAEQLSHNRDVDEQLELACDGLQGETLFECSKPYFDSYMYAEVSIVEDCSDSDRLCGQDDTGEPACVTPAS